MTGETRSWYDVDKKTGERVVEVVKVRKGTVLEPIGGWGRNQAIVEGIHGEDCTLRIEAKPGTPFDHFPPCWTTEKVATLGGAYTVTTY